jgi:hypothetical protein
VLDLLESPLMLDAFVGVIWGTALLLALIGIVRLVEILMSP